MHLTRPLSSAIRALVTSAKKTPAAIEFLARDKLPKDSTVKASPGPCDTIVEVQYSNINYKDALVVTGTYPGLKPPKTGGIDLVGTVKETTSPAYQVGQKILINGWGIGHDHDGGYAQEASVKSDWLLQLPESISALDAAKIGTAGYTAMLCIMALEEGGLTPTSGPVAVTGATGGVGSVAVAILGTLGYEVHAITGKQESEGYLKALGASSILLRSDFSSDPVPLGKEKFAGVVDAVGGNVVANLAGQVKVDSMTRQMFSETNKNINCTVIADAGALCVLFLTREYQGHTLI
jgi:acrylyl-CoA reductase (NADPH)